MTTMTPNPCCQQITERVPSPFEVKVINWYDGITEGVARCRTCGWAYHVEMLTWDQGQDIRIYGFRRILPEAFEKLVAVISVQEVGRNWDDSVSSTLGAALSSGGERTLVVVSEDLTAEVIRSKVMDFMAWRDVLKFSD